MNRLTIVLGATVAALLLAMLALPFLPARMSATAEGSWRSAAAYCWQGSPR